jgi:hypothetical protein
MDETRLKPFHPYNIILATQSRKKVGRNNLICENLDLKLAGIFLLEGSFQLLEVTS